MPDLGKIGLFASAGVGAFALLLLIISVGTTVWLDDYGGNTVGLFRKCYGDNGTVINDGAGSAGLGCINEARVTQGGLSVFGLLLLAFGVIALIAGTILNKPPILFGALGLYYFSSMFVMAAYATWGTYSREPYLYYFPSLAPGIDLHHQSMGASYHLCVAAHYFLWTALTVLAFAAGYTFNGERNAT